MKKLLTVLLAVLWAVSLKAQYTLSYQVKLDTAGHYLLVDLTIDCEFFGYIDSEERNEAILRKFKERRADIKAVP